MTQNQIQKLLSKKNYKVKGIIRLFCGDYLGHGIHRVVYEFKPDPRYVVKIIRGDAINQFSNIREWCNYQDNKEFNRLGKYMAPCVTINETGEVLIQMRVTKKPLSEYPKKIPSNFTDKKMSNCGWIGNQFVFHDYSFLSLETTRLVPVKWKNY